ncbi:ABC transporter permease [Nonomuraea sp. NPDC050404]|uniref:ABC transporter permease n=1 Tax=Nonomuraea sp. NPDC050404 TaxID=3155783 RepID=UPI0033E71826
MSLTATYRLGTRLFWRDKAMLFASVLTPVGIAVGLPTLMRHVTAEGVAAAAALSQSAIAVVLSITAFMNIGVALTGRRDQLVLKRLRCTRLTDGQILLGQMASVATQTVAIIVVCVVAVRIVAGVPLPANPVAFAAVTIAGSVVMTLLGAAYTAVIPRLELAAAYTMPVFLVCGLSAGAMGPIPLPSWLQAILDLLPTTAVVDAVRTGELAVPFLILAVWAVLGYLALRLWFRWEPRRS